MIDKKKNKMRRIYTILCNLMLLLGIASIQSCQNDLDVTEPKGGLHITLNNISSAVTRSTPSELGTPTAEMFNVKVEAANGMVKYNGPLTDETIRLAEGTYSVAVEYGENPVLALDQPYYIGTKEVTVEPDSVTEASINCKVGNALISVRFGQNEEERARFDKFYKTYALKVKIGSQSISIPDYLSNASAYFRAGSNVTLAFTGVIKDTEQEVSCDLDVQAKTDFPKPFQAADHAIVTLILPDPESATVVNISKVEVENVTLDETIPLSWLPVAMVIPMHQFDNNGLLVGTNLIITESYPGKKWRAVIANAAGTVVRAVEGTGALQSEYNAAANIDTWPYLPHGEYKASYYFVEDDGSTTFISSRDFTVEAPKNLKTTVTGYTSYSKYQAGDIDAANACDRLTIYEPSVSVNVSPSLLNNSNVSSSFSYTYDGNTTTLEKGINSKKLNNLTGQTVRPDAHVLRADLTFDGVSVTSQKEFIITGLPYSLNLASHDEWISSSGVDWFDTEVRLGKNSTGGQSITTSSAVCIPMGTYFYADYSVMLHPATVGTTLSIDVGNLTILSITENGINHNDVPHSGSTDKYHSDNQNLTTITCQNSYGAAQTRSYIYSLSFKYAKP
jgi:hypothetical protein